MGRCHNGTLGRVTETLAPKPAKPIYLRRLAYDHPLRNTLLLDLKAEFKHSAWLDFRPIEAGRPLADNTYNTLSRGWQDFYDWRIPNQEVKGSS